MYAKSPKDICMMRPNLERRLLLSLDTSLNEKSLGIFNDTKTTVKICSLLSRKKRSKTPYHVNGLLVSQQKGHYHVINRVVFDPDISFKFIPSASIVKGVANREIGLNFKSCNGPAPTFVDLYKNLRCYFTNELFEILHNHPYRRRLFDGTYVLNHLHSREKKLQIEKILKKYKADDKDHFSEIVEFWWSQTGIKFHFNKKS